ncbi:MAG: hypothetical protein Fur006_67320 [Coleofasciculaceae cyanobacterium]
MFEILTPLGFTVRTSEAYWQKLIVKHPDITELCGIILIKDATTGEPLGLELLSYRSGDRRFDTVSVEIGQQEDAIGLN